MAHEGIETDCGVWSLARKLKILRRLKLFRLVVTVLAGFWLAGFCELLQTWVTNFVTGKDFVVPFGEHA